MVGVAGKSKACHECKRRRVSCGFERPKCLRCAKIGRQCPGYERKTLFVNRTVKKPRVSTSDAISQSASPPQAPRSVLGDLDEIIQHARASPCDTRLFRQTVFNLLALIYLPRPEVSEGNPSGSAPFAWVRALCELDLPNEVLDSCLVALCSVLVYVEEQQPALYEQAIERYSAALRHLGSALRPCGSAHPEYTIASIITISTCEVGDDSLEQSTCADTPTSYSSAVQTMAGALMSRESPMSCDCVMRKALRKCPRRSGTTSARG